MISVVNDREAIDFSMVSVVRMRDFNVTELTIQGQTITVGMSFEEVVRIVNDAKQQGIATTSDSKWVG